MQNRLTRLVILLLIFLLLLSVRPAELEAGRTLFAFSPVLSAYEDSMGDVYQNVEQIFADLTGNGQNELVAVYKAAGTSSLLSYQVWHYEDGWDLWLTKEGLYQGVVLVEAGRLVERVPIYQQNDTYVLPVVYLEKVHVFGEQGPLLQEEHKKVIEMVSLETEWVNPPREEIESMIYNIAMAKGVPPVIAKAVAYTESNLRQFHNGEPLGSFDGYSWGIMQVSPHAHPDYDLERLKYDIEYNITAGVEILWQKWIANLPKIGENDPRILEDWYFAIWAYNGWSQSNNPNMMPYDHGSWIQYEAYQDKVLRFALQQFEQEITPIPPEQLPEEGRPSTSEVFATPQPIHWAQYRSYQQGDLLIDVAGLTLRNDDWVRIGTLTVGTVMEVLDGPVLYNKYIRYKILTLEEDEALRRTGWVAMNWAYPMPPSEDIGMPGDVDGNEQIDVGDAILVLRHIVGIIDIGELHGPEALLRARVSGVPGDIDVGDAILILRYIVGLIDEFPL